MSDATTREPGVEPGWFDSAPGPDPLDLPLPAPATAGAARARGAAGEISWQRLWLATQRRPWTTLALVPIGEDVLTPPLAAALAEVARQHLACTLTVCDLTGVSLPTLRAEIDAIAARARGAERTLVALPPLLGSPAGVALARAADAVVLCVALGKSAISEAERIVDDIGRDRILGSIVLAERKQKR